MYLVLSAFTSSPVSLLATTKVGRVSPFYRPQRPLERVEVELYSFMASALDGGGWSASRLGRFTPGKEPVPIV